jgi:hypothetical protein
MPKDFSFRAGNENNYKELMTINATSEEVEVRKLSFMQSKARIESINGSVIIRLG